MLKEFDELVKQRRELKEWWMLGSKLAGYDKEFHKLRVDIGVPSMVAFCGQASAGAKNYHDAPKFFLQAIRIEMEKQSRQMVKEAYDREFERLSLEIENLKSEVLKQLSNE